MMRERRAVVLVRHPEVYALTASCCVCTFLASTLFPLSLDGRTFFLRVHFFGEPSINACGFTRRAYLSRFLISGYFYFLAQIQINPIR